LPALPATTPRAAASPSAAIFVSAPRSLNEPVRCRLSAFSSTRPPQASPMLREVNTGVRRTMSAIASRASATSI
jgi:hypothetical protein